MDSVVATVQPRQRRGLADARGGLGPGVCQADVLAPLLDGSDELGVRGVDGPRVVAAVGRGVRDEKGGQVLQLVGGIVGLETDPGDPAVGKGWVEGGC